MALDGNIKALMTNTVSWEAYTGLNAAGENTYATAVSISCWIEESALQGGGVIDIEKAGENVNDPAVDIYLDANDANVASMRMEDRLTVAAGVEVGAIPLIQNPKEMTVFYGQFGEPWVKAVRL